MSIKYEHETSLEGCCAVIRGPDPVHSFHPCHQSGEDQNPGATHRFCEWCPSRRHDYEFEQHRCPAGRHLAEHRKMKEQVTMLLNEAYAANPAMTSRFHTKHQARGVADARRCAPTTCMTA